MTIEQLRILVAEAMGVTVESIPIDARFEDLPDYDSVVRLGILMALTDEGFSVDLAQASEFQSLPELHSLLTAVK